MKTVVGDLERSRDLDYQLRVPLIATLHRMNVHTRPSKLWEGWQKKGPTIETGRRWVYRLMDQSDAEMGSIDCPAEQIGLLRFEANPVLLFWVTEVSP